MQKRDLVVSAQSRASHFTDASHSRSRAPAGRLRQSPHIRVVLSRGTAQRLPKLSPAVACMETQTNGSRGTDAVSASRRIFGGSFRPLAVIAEKRDQIAATATTTNGLSERYFSTATGVVLAAVAWMPIGSDAPARMSVPARASGSPFRLALVWSGKPIQHRRLVP